ncbi:MAG TPA: ABC transporter substrate-binding protein [Candidatus Binatia bacterium]|jgi:NitT/TauT family transport system substrate-binding protein
MHNLKRYSQLLAVTVVIVSLLFAAGAYSAETSERPLEKLTIAYSSVSGNMAPLWITHERGFFRKNGLDVQIVFIESGSTAVQSLSNKDVAFAQMAGAGVLQSRLRGSDVVMIAGFLNTLDYQLMVEKSITRPEQLRGKSMAVSRFGSSSDFATRYALEKLGLVPEKDVTILEIGSQPARFAALESGKIQAAMIAVPLTVRAKALGFRVLADLQMLGLEYQHTGLVTTQALIKSRPDLVRNVMKSYVEGIHYYKTNRPESIAILAKYLKTNDSELLNEVYTDLGLTLTPQKPYPTLRGIDIMLREMAARDAKAKAARPEDFVDLTFIKELDSSGYIDRLYKAQPVVATRQEPPAAAPPAPSPKAPAQPKAAPPTAKVATAKAAPAAAAPSDGAQEYTVVSGDTLSHLAQRFYGDHYQWNKIYEANKSTMKNPNFLFIGQRILIPS